MTALTIAGWGVVGPAADSPEALATALGAAPQPVPVTGMYADELPDARAHALVGFDVKAHLRRRGTAFFDRRTSLTVVACGRAIEDAGLVVTDDNRDRIGIVTGTTAGSVKSSVDYAAETFTQQPPYLVNPALFPNTVMNCAAGQSAIWYKLHGPNATVAGGPLAFLTGLRYSANLFRRGRADVLLAATVEEFTPHAAWTVRRTGGTLAGEGGAAFVLRREPDGPADGAVLAVRAGFCPAGQSRPAALSALVRATLAEAGVDGADVTTVACGRRGDARDDAEVWSAVDDGLGGRSPAERLHVDDVVGDCQAATGAWELAAVLARHRADPGRDGAYSLLVARTPEGGVGAAVVRGRSRR
ncbi:beta-ketoacyl synthase [Micromonospora sp. BRA006-A]|uniref:beta-ketoacyl synthase N-terminal-like domain-containing protein n=1 Tax=Micromonospora sp. BRA006-A TaxID=2962860 RepID=UPI00296F42E3|nr:beta-ketoacyl synthase N-terminal-like domain-containing protein [Micromonospora sp. BRA006-A]MDW3849353.1 beta-ketoacyl synthase [Micromonospora sp. BRA006-A]